MTGKKLRRVTRDGILFVTGLAGIAYETIIGLERPTLLLLFAAMIGLPAFLQADEKRSERGEKQPEGDRE